jgi:signal transduction histidine kinase
LWIAQQIAVAHGGDLRAGNAAAGGAVFTLTLPLQPKE